MMDPIDLSDLNDAFALVTPENIQPVPGHPDREWHPSSFTLVAIHIEYHGSKFTDARESGTELLLDAVLRAYGGTWWYLQAGNDYTGWGCMGDFVAVRHADDFDSLWNLGLEQIDRERWPWLMEKYGSQL